VLYLSSNELTQVSPEIGNLPELRNLYLTGNKLTLNQVPVKIKMNTRINIIFDY